MTRDLDPIQSAIVEVMTEPRSEVPLSEDILRGLDALCERLESLRQMDTEIIVGVDCIAPDHLALIGELVTAAYVLSDGFVDLRKKLAALAETQSRKAHEGLILPPRAGELVVPK